ncbi:MAG TPA: hypothetical protein VD905_03545, partial [Flavobacteriales bacterium]|nr:hypothetical protein [Flavobacteriales bacterium]
MDIKNIPLNPLIALREKHKELIELTGYAGYKPEKIMRLYPDVKSPVHIEFPVESILHIELTCKDCGESTRITVYLQAETEIKLIEPIKAGGYNPHKYNPFGEVPQYPHLPFGQIPQFPRLPWNIFPNPACAERCIQAIARNQGYFVLVDGGRNTIRYVLTQEGKN